MTTNQDGKFPDPDPVVRMTNQSLSSYIQDQIRRNIANQFPQLLEDMPFERVVREEDLLEDGFRLSPEDVEDFAAECDREQAMIDCKRSADHEALRESRDARLLFGLYARGMAE